METQPFRMIRFVVSLFVPYRPHTPSSFFPSSFSAPLRGGSRHDSLYFALRHYRHYQPYFLWAERCWPPEESRPSLVLFFFITRKVRKYIPRSQVLTKVATFCLFFLPMWLFLITGLMTGKHCDSLWLFRMSRKQYTVHTSCVLREIGIQCILIPNSQNNNFSDEWIFRKCCGGWKWNISWKSPRNAQIDTIDDCVSKIKAILQYFGFAQF